jgi:WD40 repeat protein
VTVSEYRDFDVLITDYGDRYRALVVESPEGEASVVFDAPFHPDEVIRIAGLLSPRRDRSKVAADARAQRLTEFGRRLFAAVFRDGLLRVLAASLATAAREGAGLRVRLRFDEYAAELAGLPWEALYDEEHGQFLGLGAGSPIVRYLPLARSRSALLVEPPLRVLAVLCSPADLPALDLEQEWRSVQSALGALVSTGKLVLERLETPSRRALQQRLLGEPVHILHFAGHGLGGDKAALALEDPHSRASAPITGQQLGTLLRDHGSLRLTFLNACHGALSAGESLFTGVAQSVVRQGVPAAVAMQAEISDDAAVELAETFYTALATGLPVDAAMTQARVALSTAGSAEWLIPVIFSRSPDNRLFDIRDVLPTPDCPYPGMAPFTERQAEVFFGRDREVEYTLERLREYPFLAVIGPSGSGKSSLIHAGVIPALRSSGRFGEHWTIRTMRPGVAPMASLTDAVRVSDGARVLLVIDQFEELFTRAEPAEAQAFLDAIDARRDLTILLAARADFYSELMACSLWTSIQANRLELAPLGENELWSAIVEPAARVGVTIDDALAVRLVDDAAGETGVLPLVQETLVVLWDRVRRRRLGLEAYRAIAEGQSNAIHVAIDRRASVVYDNLSDDGRPVAQRIVLRLVQFGEGRADTRRQQRADELMASGDDPLVFERTLGHLIDARLLTVGGDAERGDRLVDIAHEALITGWSRLQDWLSERRAAEQVRRRLESRARDWQASGKRAGLLDGYGVEEAERWLAGAHDLGHSEALMGLIEASRAALGAAVAERDAQRRRELEQAQALAEEQRGRAEAARRIALSALALALASRAIDLAERYPEQDDLAALLACHAYRFSVGSGNVGADWVDRALRAALALPHFGGSLRTRGDVSAVAFAPDGRWLASGTTKGEIEVWDVGQHNVVRALLRDRDQAPVRVHTASGPIHWLSLGPDGGVVAAVSGDGEVQVWRGSDEPESIGRAVLMHNNRGFPTIPPFAVAATPDARSIAYRATDGVCVWRDGMHIEPFACEPCRAIAFAPGGQDLVVVGENAPFATRFRIDRRDAPVESTELRGWTVVRNERGVNLIPTIAIAPGGEAVAQLPKYRTSPGQASVWRLDHGESAAASGLRDSQTWTSDSARRGSAPGDFYFEGAVTMQFSPGGQRLAIASPSHRELGATAGGEVRVWDVGRTRKAPDLLRGEPVRAVAFSPAADLLAAGGSELRLWRLRSRDVTSTILERGDAPVRAVAFSPDSQMLVADAGGRFRQWEIRHLERGASTIDLAPADHAVPFCFTNDARSVVMTIVDGDREALAIVDLAGAKEPSILGAPPVQSDVGMRETRSLGFFAAAIAPDGRLWSVDFDAYSFRNTGAGQAFLRTWDVDSSGEEASFAGPFGGLSPLMRLSPDAAALASVANPRDQNVDAAINVLDVASLGHQRVRWVCGKAMIDSIAWRGDSLAVAAGARDGTITVWDRTSPGSSPVLLRGHRDPVSSLAFSPDGHTLASGSGDLTLRLWDLRRPRSSPIVLEGHDDAITTLAFSPDHRVLASGGEDGTIRLWVADPTVLFDLVRARVARDLGPEEWEQYVGPEVEYETVR